jgi:ribosome-associated toxin RatA of RatAB toxin-antitoxin module
VYIVVTVIGRQGSGMGHVQRAVAYLVVLVACNAARVATGGEDWQRVADGWEFLHRVDGVELYRKPVAGSRFPALQARTRLTAPAASVFRVISDYDHFTDFIPSVTASLVLAQSGVNTRVYQRLDLPMLFADRQYVIQVTDTLEDAHHGLVRVNWQLDKSRSHALTASDAVLPEAFTGFWSLRDTPDGSGCDAIYAIHVEPGGRLPAWLFSRAAERYVTDVVAAVRKQVMLRAAQHR